MDQFQLGGLQRGLIFMSSSSIFSSITRLGIILCLHISSLLFMLFTYCSLWLNMAQSSVTGLLHLFTLISHLISWSKSNLAIILKLGSEQALVFSD